MASAHGWDAARAAAACAVVAWQGSAWRVHNGRYAPEDPGGSFKVSGRYNRGLDGFSPDQIWPALYLSLSPEISLAEMVRHLEHEGRLKQLKGYRLSRLEIRLRQVLDCRDFGTLGLSPEDLLEESYEAGQALSAAVL
jgi:RES domain-containing protein